MADVYQNWILYNVGKAIKNGNEYSFDWTMLNEYNQLQQQYSDYQSSINGIQADLKTSIENKWVTVPSSAALSTYPSYIDQIKTIDDTPMAITWSQLYWWYYSVWSRQSISWITWIASYATDNFVLIWYAWDWQTYDNYDQKDVHLLVWKKWQNMRSVSADMWKGTTYFFRNGATTMTRENDWASYLLTSKAYYLTDSWVNRWYKTELRYTVASDTLTTVWVTEWYWADDPRPWVVDNDMFLYTANYQITHPTRIALFTLRNT